MSVADPMTYSRRPHAAAPLRKYLPIYPGAIFPRPSNLMVAQKSRKDSASTPPRAPVPPSRLSITGASSSYGDTNRCFRDAADSRTDAENALRLGKSFRFPNPVEIGFQQVGKKARRTVGGDV